MTTEQIESIVYFWREKRDLERWAGWDEALPVIERERPEVAKAWRDYKASIAILDAVVKMLNEDLY